MSRRSPLPEPLDHQPFTNAQARQLGVPSSRLRSRDLSAPFRGVRAFGDPQQMSIEDRVAAYAPLLREGQFFSHTTAAVLIGMRMPTGFREDVLHVSTIAPHRAPRAKGVVGHQWTSPPEVWDRNRLRVASAVDTWISLGARFSLTDLVVMGDGLVRRKQPFTSMSELLARVEALGSKRGSGRLRTAVEFIRPGTDSAPETRLRLLLVEAGCPEPEVNGVVQTLRGPFHGDLVFRSERVIVEYDGEQHRLDDRQFAIDVDRLDAIAAARWRVIRVDKRLLRRSEDLIARVRHALSD